MLVTNVFVIRNARFELTTSRSQTERSTKLSQFRVIKWSITDLNRYLLTCKVSALPIKLKPQNTTEVLSNMSSKDILINVIAEQLLRS